nr:hypothetical protein [Nitrospirota bacterium]
MNAHQERFLKDELFSLTLMATVQRANVYAKRSPDKGRKAFRAALQALLEEIAQAYGQEVLEETHIRNILELSRRLTSVHSKVLRSGRFRIGPAQKALNLYLKYLWCLGAIPRPPHCPFDFQIIKKLPTYTGPSWTALETEADYRNLIKAAKATAQSDHLADWELKTYNNTQPGTTEDVRRSRAPGLLR